MWIDTFNSAFFLTVAGIVAGIISVLVNGCLKSRCKDVKFCCIECVRDTEAEDREAMAAAPTRAETLVANNV